MLSKQKHTDAAKPECLFVLAPIHCLSAKRLSCDERLA